MQAMGILFIVVGISIFVSAKSAIPEIEAFIVLLIATVLICSGSLRDVLTKMRHDILDRLPERKASSPLFIHPIQTSNSAAHWESILVPVIVVLLLLALTLFFFKDQVISLVSGWQAASQPSESK